MRDLFADIGVFYGKRRSVKQRIRFIKYLESQLKNKELKVIKNKDKFSESIHLVVGNLQKAKKVIITPYDTGSKMLIPYYQYTPLDSKNNFASEIINSTLYIILGLLILVLMLFVSKGFKDYGLLMKIVIIVADLVLTFIAMKMFKNLDNQNNFNRNSQGVAVLVQTILKSKNDVAYIFVDQAIMVNSGYKAIQPLVQDKEILLLDCIGNQEAMYLACNKKYKERAKNIASMISNEMNVIELDDVENCPLKYFNRGFMFVSGEMNNDKLTVNQIRTSKDINVNIERLEDIVNKLINY